MTNDRFDRNARFFGKEGQEKLANARVAVIGVGGLGTHVVQQLSHLGVRHLALVDNEELAETNRNRYVGARHDDPIPGTLKVDIGERVAHAIDPAIRVERISESLVSDAGFAAVINADYVFGCLDTDGTRLILNELAAVYARPYLDLATEIFPGSLPAYGGRVCVAWDGHGCVFCSGVLDIAEAQIELSGAAGHRAHEALYGVDHAALEAGSGPSVVSVNGVVASLGVTEFMVGVTGLRRPHLVITYHGHRGVVTRSLDEPASDCPYCKGIRGRGDAADVRRYLDDTTAPR